MSKSKKKVILITNDDGYFSDGINALYEELRPEATVYMVAPDREQSASSHSLTLNRPLRMHKLDSYRYAIDGTPTDCVMLATHMVMKKHRPDMIISGINHGANMGDDVTYSGTVAATIEGSILGIPSIAVSMAHYEPGMAMEGAARFVSRFVQIYDELEVDPSVFLNINLPADNGSDYERFEFTRQGVRQYKDAIIHKTDPRGKPYYWIGGKPVWKRIKGTDFYAVEHGIVSVTPLRLNFTDSDTLERFRRSGVKLR